MPALGFMRRRLLSTPLAIVPVCALILAAPVSASGVVPAAVPVPRWAFLSGSVPLGLALAQRLQPLSRTRQIGISVALRARDESGLSRFLAAVYDPSSPSYHHFLTVPQFVERFGPTAATQRNTIDWLKSRGLHVSGTSRNGMLISVHGTVATVEAAFATSLYTYRQGIRTFFANTQVVRLPGSLAANVMAVSGLSTMARQQPAQTHTQAQSAPPGYGPSDLQSLYDVTPLVSQGLNGSGQTVGIVSFGDYTMADIDGFDRQFGLPAANVNLVAVSDGVTSGSLLGSKNGQDEAESDIEILHGMAPKARVLVYEAPNSSQGGIALYNKLASDNRASVITTSWGGVETGYSSDEINAVDQTLQEAAAQGQSFLSVSGDSGAYDGAGVTRNGDTTLAVDFPASDPWVTSVGGTTLETNGLNYARELAWSDSSVRPAAGSGGGLSTIFRRPSYQSGPGVDNQYSNGLRQVPDVAADADPSTGYAVYTVDPNDHVSWGVSGGTSVATPLWAGFVALLDQAMGKRLGFLNPTLYALGQRASSFAHPPFHDVTQGTNLYYAATPGWDFATGWGSFDGAAFLADLQTLSSTPGAIPTTTVPASPLPTATPKPTSIPPTITIKQMILLHAVQGKQKTTNTLKVGEKGTIVILYQSKNAGSAQTYGSVVLRQKGQLLQALTLKPSTYGGKPALMATVHFTSKKRVGTLQVRATLTIGAVSTALDHIFKIVTA